MTEQENKACALRTGIKGRAETEVTFEKTAKYFGSGNEAVFATPVMIGIMEEASLTSVQPYLAEDESTVGTRVNVTHESASPVGIRVWAESELIEIDRRRLVFRVTAYDECGIIGRGEHERFIIKKDKFTEKTKAKLSK